MCKWQVNVTDWNLRKIYRLNLESGTEYGKKGEVFAQENLGLVFFFQTSLPVKGRNVKNKLNRLSIIHKTIF